MTVSGILSSQNALRIFAGFLIAQLTLISLAATIEQETVTRLDQIRVIRAEGDGKTTERYNKQLDETWKFFIANKKAVLPILRKELSSELRKDKPNNMLLLDIGYFVRLQEEPSDKLLGKQALFALDTTVEVVRWNQQQLFHFAHAVATDRDPRTLPFLDKTFLQGKVTAFIPQHALTLDETLVCVFLYGIYGQGAEEHLKSMLIDRNLARKIIEILIWIGSSDSIQEVKSAMMASPDYETFARATAFMMKVGGPQGRTIMLGINPKEFDAKTQEYYGKIRRDIEATTYEVLRKQFSGYPGTPKLGDAEVRKRLSAMYLTYGKNDKTSPEAIVYSGLPSNFLISELTRIRERMFYRLSDEALSDVVMTNAILNALRYRGR